MPWLVCDSQVLASADIASDRATKRKGLIGRDGFEGALVIQRCRWVHTIGMRFPIDVAYLDRDGAVIRTAQMSRRRIGLPVFGAHTVIEANAGAFARWGLHLGDVIEIHADDV